MKKKEVKRLLVKIGAVGLAGALMCGEFMMTALPVQAAETEKQWELAAILEEENKEQLRPDSVEDIFDAEYYRTKYPDVAAAFGTDEKALLLHFKLFGLKEGRQGSRVLDIAGYRALYPDLDAAFGDNWDLYVWHYFHLGRQEGRSNGLSQPDRSTVKAEDSKIKRHSNGTISDDQGNVLIPWDKIVSEESLTLEMLREKCGDTLVLLVDEAGNVTFVGGNFSGVKVTDEKAAKESLKCMMALLGFPEETTSLYLTHQSTDSKGDTYYRFSAEKDGALLADTDIVVGVDKEGNVVCLSSSSGTKYYNEAGEPVLSEEMWEQEREWLLSIGYTLLEAESRLVYDAELNQYCQTEYYERDGIIMELRKPIAQAENIYNMNFYDKLPTEDSYSFDYFFQDIPTQDMTFTDYYGNQVTLPVAWEEGKGYYVLDLKRKIVGVDSVTDPMMESYEPHYFQRPEDLNANYVTSLLTIQKSWDTYAKFGLFSEEEPTALMVELDPETIDNASCANFYGAMIIKIYDNAGNSCFDGVSHELGHGALAKIGGNLKYANATGAINESYADILGNLLEMLAYADGQNVGDVNFDQWYIGEGVGMDAEGYWHIIRNMTNPEEFLQPDKIGGAYYVIGAGEGKENYANDYGGVHTNSGILNYICYRMYKEADIPLESLLNIWYDSLLLLNEDSDYQDMQGYLEYTLRRYDLEEKIPAVKQFFEEANVACDAKNWSELTAAEGASKVNLVVDNLPEGAQSMAFFFVNGGFLPIVQDEKGEQAAILKEGDWLDGIGFIVQDEAAGLEEQVEVSTLQPIGEADEDIRVDYYDLAAAALTNAGKTDSVPEAYENALRLITVVLSNMNDDTALWKVDLMREHDAEENTNLDILLGAAQEKDENGVLSDTQKLVAQKNHEYQGRIVVLVNGDMYWMEIPKVAATDSDETVHVTFDTATWNSTATMQTMQADTAVLEIAENGGTAAAAKAASGAVLAEEKQAAEELEVKEAEKSEDNLPVADKAETEEKAEATEESEATEDMEAAEEPETDEGENTEESENAEKIETEETETPNEGEDSEEKEPEEKTDSAKEEESAGNIDSADEEESTGSIDSAEEEESAGNIDSAEEKESAGNVENSEENGVEKVESGNDEKLMDEMVSV